ncbi:MAG TPA: hypothetical protein VGP41_18185, partial [Candidatus Lustribacter sp.]|nr:hypothetical protein [Candidatus Lustribacter sp.]
MHGQALARFGFLLFAFATIVLCGATFAGRQAQAQTCPDNLISGGIAWSGRTVLLVASPGIEGVDSGAWNAQNLNASGQYSGETGPRAIARAGVSVILTA